MPASLAAATAAGLEGLCGPDDWVKRRGPYAGVELLRAWFLCPHCHNGQFPADVALDIEKLDLSPGVRRMLALVGSDAPFDHGRRQIELLAGAPRGLVQVVSSQ